MRIVRLALALALVIASGTPLVAPLPSVSADPCPGVGPFTASAVSPTCAQAEAEVRATINSESRAFCASEGGVVCRAPSINVLCDQQQSATAVGEGYIGCRIAP
jgi:hypothetical protein